MNPDVLFKNFDLIAEMPGGVAKLRELILEWAFQGKLCPQSTNDEPASKQIDRIAKIVVERGLSKKKVDSKHELSFNKQKHKIPAGWESVALADLVTIYNGRAYSKHELLDSGTPVLRVGNLFTSNHWYYSNLVLEPEKYCDKGDLLFAWSASFGPFIWDGPKVIYHYHIWKLGLHSEDDLDKFFLYQFLKYKTQEIKHAGHGVSMLHMTKDSMEKLVVKLPPLAEQKRIVAKVDELMALCDRLDAQHAERQARRQTLTRAAIARFTADPTIANLQYLFDPDFAIEPDDLRKVILTLAVRGKLVRQEEGDGSAQDYIEEIKTFNKTAISKTSIADTAKDDDGFNCEYEIPKNWVWARLGDIVINRDSERVPVNKDDRHKREKKYDYYGASGIIDRIDAYLFDKPLLLIGEDGANLLNRSTPIAFIARGKYWVNNHAHVLDGISEDFLKYLELYINAIDLRKYVTGSAQPKMNQAKMNSIPIALPPEKECKRIIYKVSELICIINSQIANIIIMTTAL